MNEMLVNDFNGRCISTFFWKDKICFLLFEITSVLGYAEGKFVASYSQRNLSQSKIGD